MSAIWENTEIKEKILLLSPELQVGVQYDSS